MSATCDFYIAMAERGLVPIEDAAALPEGFEAKETEYETRSGETMVVPCITINAARWWSMRPGCPAFVPAFLEDFAWLRRNNATATRLAGEIVAAVAAGEELPDEWHSLDCYAGIGEPMACEIVRLVREELEPTGIRP